MGSSRYAAGTPQQVAASCLQPDLGTPPAARGIYKPLRLRVTDTRLEECVRRARRGGRDRALLYRVV